MGDEIEITVYLGYKITYDTYGKVFKATDPDGEYFNGDKSQKDLQDMIALSIMCKIKKQEAYLKRYGGLTECSINSVNLIQKKLNVTSGGEKVQIYSHNKGTLYKVNENNTAIKTAVDKARAQIGELEKFIYEELKKVTEPITYEDITKS